MAEIIFTPGFFEVFKVIIVAILVYAIVFAMLKTINIFGDNKGIDALIALVAAIIVSFSGAVTYAIAYAINWFVIIMFIIFLLLVLLMFLGVKPGDIANVTKDNGKIIIGAFVLLFLIILVKSFFAVNNAYDLNNPQYDQYDVDTSFNTGTDDIFLEDGEKLETDINIGFNTELGGVAFFLLIIGIFIFLIGRN